MSAIWWVLAIWGELTDRKYLKRGGKKPTRLELFLWADPLILFGGYFFVMSAANSQDIDWHELAQSVSGMIAVTLPAYLSVYEGWRCLVRWRHPTRHRLSKTLSVTD